MSSSRDGASDQGQSGSASAASAEWRDVAGTADDPNALAERRVLVMGLGLLGGGVGAARYAAQHGAAEVVITDLRDADVLAQSMRKLTGLPIRYVLGRHDPADFVRADVVVRNPGVRRSSPYLSAAQAAGARIEMEIAWFFRECAVRGGKIAGVTGTRGKSTTTMLLHTLLREGGLDPLLGGNLGGIETLALLPEITPGRWVALELGNWMLEGLHTIRRSPQLAIFTNLLPDHLDAYDSMEDYGEAKSSIFRYQRPEDIALFNAENEVSRRYGESAPSEHVWFYSATRGGSWLRGKPEGLRPFAYGDAMTLRGEHNVANVLVATRAAELIGVATEAIRAGVTSFGGVPHRLETVRVLDGVTYVNDSASTAPVAGVAALKSFGEPVVLIAGGNTKKLDASEYAAEAARRAKRVILLAGNASDEFAAAIRTSAREHGRTDAEELVIGPLSDLDEALRQAWTVATSGDVVLFSPAFTSFGMFLNEFDRGDRFREAVQALPEA